MAKIATIARISRTAISLRYLNHKTCASSAGSVLSSLAIGMRLRRASLCHAPLPRARSLLQLVPQSHQDWNRRQHAHGEKARPALRRSSFSKALLKRRPIPTPSAPRVIAISPISGNVKVMRFALIFMQSAPHFNSHPTPAAVRCASIGTMYYSWGKRSDRRILKTDSNRITRSDPQTEHRRLQSLQIRRARKEDRETIWQIFHAVVAKGDTYVFDPNISRRKALAYWLGPKTRCYVALSDQGIV